MGDSHMPIGGDSTSSTWFTGTGGRTWDFCSPAQPRQMGDGLPAATTVSSIQAPALLLVPPCGPASNDSSLRSAWSPQRVFKSKQHHGEHVLGRQRLANDFHEFFPIAAS